jgi:hypothetical protein
VHETEEEPMSTTLLPRPHTTAVLLTAAAAGEVVEQLLSPLDGDSTRRDLDAIAAHQGIFQVSVLVGLVATVLYLPGFLGLAQACRARSPRLAATAGWLAAFSMTGFMAVRLGQAVELATVQTDGNRADLARAVDHVGATAIGAPILLMFLGGALVGLVLFAVAGWRAGLPRVACILLAVFQPVDFVIPQSPFPLGVVSHLLLLAAMLLIAPVLWRSGRATAHRSTAPAPVVAQGAGGA